MLHPRHLRSVPSTGPDLAEQLLALVDAEPDGTVILLGSTHTGSGGYGLLSVDPYSTTTCGITVRMFGWPRLTPGHEAQSVSAISAMAADGFSFNGADWMWARPYRPELVVVAAYAVQRALADGWAMIGTDVGRLVRPLPLDAGDLALMAANVVCSRCVGDCCTHVPDGSGSLGC